MTDAAPDRTGGRAGDRVGDVEAVRRLLHVYCQTVDDGRFDEWAQIWTDDARFTVMGRTVEGREALVAFITAAQPPERRGKHVTTNSIIEVAADGASATAASDFLFVAPADGGFAVTQVGRYLDRLVHGDGGWRIAERRIVLWGDGQVPG